VLPEHGRTMDQEGRRHATGRGGDWGRGEGRSGELVVHVLCPILHGERTLSSAASDRAKTSLVS